MAVSDAPANEATRGNEQFRAAARQFLNASRLNKASATI